jgi:hypothetical protein
MFIILMRVLGPLALAEWTFVHLFVVAMPSWTLFATLGMAVVISALFAFKILRTRPPK